MSTTLRFETNVFDPDKGSSPVRTVKKDFDVNAWEVFAQAEQDVAAFGRESNAILMNEAIKKKKRRWSSHLWNVIRRWFGMERSPSASGE